MSACSALVSGGEWSGLTDRTAGASSASCYLIAVPISHKHPQNYTNIVGSSLSLCGLERSPPKGLAAVRAVDTKQSALLRDNSPLSLLQYLGADTYRNTQYRSKPRSILL